MPVLGETSSANERQLCVVSLIGSMRTSAIASVAGSE
jgi:hypothetical protein